MDIMFQELNTPFNVESILRVIGQLNTNKSAGPDMFLMNVSCMVNLYCPNIYLSYLIKYLN